jgi:hypothetical protein
LEAEAEAQRKLTEATDKYAAAEKEATAARKAKNAAAVAAQGAEADLKAVQTKSQEQLNKEAAALTRLKEALIAVNPKYKDLAIEGKNTSE